MKRRFLQFGLVLSAFLVLVSAANAPRTITLATTTSTLDSGLLDELIPAFEKKENCRVKVIAVGTGQAIKLASDGNADVILVHDRKSEEKFVRDGCGAKRVDIMYNDFVIVGPVSDHAAIAGGKNAIEVFEKIASAKSVFVARGDNSGTHKKELSLWDTLKKKTGQSPFRNGDSPQKRGNAGQSPAIWYIESGAGMEQALRIANEKNAYCLTDRATWLVHEKELAALKIAVEGDKILFNPYSVILVSPAKFPWVNYNLSMKFVEFLTGKDGQNIIENFGKTKYGQPLFYLPKKGD